MFCQIVIYKYGPWSLPGDRKYKRLGDILTQRPYCWDSGIVKLIDKGSRGVLLYKCSADKNIDETKWLKLKGKSKLENKIDPIPLYMLDPARMCWGGRQESRVNQ